MFIVPVAFAAAEVKAQHPAAAIIAKTLFGEWTMSKPSLDLTSILTHDYKNLEKGQGCFASSSDTTHSNERARRTRAAAYSV
jgi:hypothetical protein